MATTSPEIAGQPGRVARSGLMHRPIEHTAFVRRPYDDVCFILERHGAAVLAAATAAASQRSAALVEASNLDLAGFDASEALLIRMIPLAHDQHHRAWMEFSWDANPTKRLLANVDTRLDIRPLVKRGPAAITEITLRARYDPATSTRRSPESALFGRRVVKAALHRLLESLTTSLEDFEDSIFA